MIINREKSMQELIANFSDKIAENWFSALASLLASWFLIRQKYIRDEHDGMKKSIANLERRQATIDATLDNVKTNQKLMRDTQNEIRTDIKTLLKNSSPKAWWQK